MATKEVMYAAPLLVLLHEPYFSFRDFRQAHAAAAMVSTSALAATWLLLGWV